MYKWSWFFERVLCDCIIKAVGADSVRKARPGKPMTDQDKLVTLIRLRDVIYFGVQPTLRQSGFPVGVVQELAKEGLLVVGDRKLGDVPDRYFIERILPAGHAFISQQHALHEPLGRHAGDYLRTPAP